MTLGRSRLIRRELSAQVRLRKSDKPFMDRIVGWLKKFPLDFPVEVFPYTEKELGNPIVLDAIKNGITLFERDNAIVGGGAVVTENVDANTVVGGVPAKVIK